MNEKKYMRQVHIKKTNNLFSDGSKRIFFFRVKPKKCNAAHLISIEYSAYCLEFTWRIFAFIDILMVQHACGQKSFVPNKIGNKNHIQMNKRNKRNSLHIHINSIIIQCENVKTKIIAGAFMNNLIGKTRNKACKPRFFGRKNKQIPVIF